MLTQRLATCPLFVPLHLGYSAPRKLTKRSRSLTDLLFLPYSQVRRLVEDIEAVITKTQHGEAFQELLKPKCAFRT